jgi:transposase InsO family protein
VPPVQIQDWRRSNFARWGLPERVRVDNGRPWGNGQDLPPALSLWLLGLGVGVIWNPPRRPQSNGHVERFNGLLEQWGEPRQCADWAAWGEHLRWVVETQRERYPACEGQSRQAAYPELEQNPRYYDPQREEAEWQLARVYAHLAQGTWRRVVNKTGQISLYNRGYQVGRSQRGETVFVQFDGSSECWVVQDRVGRELARRPHRELGRDQIVQLQVGHIKAFRRKQRAGRGPNLLASCRV